MTAPEPIEDELPYTRLAAGLADQDEGVRRAAAEALVRLGTPLHARLANWETLRQQTRWPGRWAA